MLIRDSVVASKRHTGYQRPSRREYARYMYIYVYTHMFFSHANMHTACGRQGGNGITGVKGVQDGGTDWTRTIFSFFLFFLNFFPLLLHVRIQSTDNGIDRVNGWSYGVALVDDRRRSEDLAEAYPLSWFSPSTLLAGQTGRSRRAQFSFLALGPCVSCIRWDMMHTNVMLVRSHARERAARSFRDRLSSRALSAVWRIAWSIFTEVYLDASILRTQRCGHFFGSIMRRKFCEE